MSLVYVQGRGPINPKIAIVGIAPGQKETLKGEPFVGPSGRLLSEDLEEAGSSLSQCYRTNVFKFQLPDDDFWKHEKIGLNLNESLKELREELDSINPNIIIGLGDPVLYSLAGKSGKNNGINVWRGSILSAFGRKAIFTYHPSHELHGSSTPGQYKPWQKYIRKFDIARGVANSVSAEISNPYRNLWVAKGFADVERYIDRLLSSSQNPYCSVDIESIEGIPVCIGLSFDPSEGLSIPLWNLLNVSVTDEEHPKKSKNYKLEVSTIPNYDLAYIWNLLSKLFINKKVRFVGQNFKYDDDKLNKLGFFFHSLYADTMISGHVISSELPKGLAFQTSLYTQEPYYKFEGREFVPGKDKIDIFFIYNARDAAVTLEIFLAHLKEFEEIPHAFDHFINFRMRLHNLYHWIENCGFLQDKIVKQELIHKYVSWLIRLEKELYDITQLHTNIASPKQVGILLYETLQIPLRKGTGEEVLFSLLANTVKEPKVKRILEIILEWRKVDRTINHVLKPPADYDGRMRTSYFITATETFRTSTGILDQPERPKKMGVTFHGLTKHGDVGNDIRSQLVADPGYCLMNFDQAQAEPRVCALLANDEETLTLMDKIEFHGMTAEKIFGGVHDKRIVGYETPERFIGKTIRNAYNLGIGKHEAMINVNTKAQKYKIKGVNISEGEAARYLKVLQRITPKIETIFQEEVKEALKRDRRLFGTEGASRYFYAEWGRELWKEGWAFIPQQTVTDKTKRVALGIMNSKTLTDVRIVVEAHDALTLLVPLGREKDVRDEVFELGKIPISFENCSIPRRDLTIPWDCEIGDNYMDMEKFKG